MKERSGLLHQKVVKSWRRIRKTKFIEEVYERELAAELEIWQDNSKMRKTEQIVYR